jgi:hypothetical protein
MAQGGHLRQCSDFRQLLGVLRTTARPADVIRKLIGADVRKPLSLGPIEFRMIGEFSAAP